MQIFALEQNRLVHAPEAEKRKNYTCPECKAIVRLKAGGQRTAHFFHIKKSFSCRLARKGLIHLRLQRYIQYLFEEEEAEMEKPFPSIGRIADVACPLSKRTYEIQYSPMSPEEASSRCHDYESIGYQVIWVLHDHTYNRRKTSPVEQFLRTKKTCYYTNMDKEGNGMIYDQLAPHGKRPVNLRKCRPLAPHNWPEPLFYRGQNWPCFHEGDYFDLSLHGRFPVPEKSFNALEALKMGYLDLLHMLLERSCR